MQYYIVKCDLQRDREHGDAVLVKAVREWLEEGWKPQGGIAIDKDGYFYQAMIKD